MAATSGRDLIIKKDGTAIAAVQSKGVSINNEPVDITSDDDDAWRTVLAEPGLRSIDIDVSGVTTDDILLAAISAGTSSVALQTIVITYPSGALHSGSFSLNNLTRTGESAGAVTFSATLASSGEITYTPAA